VQTRLLACAAGGLLGASLTSLINSALLGLTPTLGFIACTLAGAAIGYSASLFLDVFRTDHGSFLIRPPE
jgi:hypothetical protein